MKNFPVKQRSSPPALLAATLLRCYQIIFSPDHGVMHAWYGNARCRFYPSCSAYALESLRQYGFLQGFVVSVKRIAKCNPWHQGGYDPVKLL